MRMLTLAMLLLGATAPQAPPGFKIEGDRWIYTDATRTLKGILLKPEGKGPFPGLLISHGMGGSAETFSRRKAQEFVKWGFVCVATDYTHFDGKGDRKEFGASPENIVRAKICLDLLAGLSTVDSKRLAAYGNSMGALLTIGLAAAAPERLAASAITAGGVNEVSGFPAPSVEEAAKIRSPFLILHGSKDTTVPPERSALLKDALEKNKVVVERQVFEGIGHNLHQEKADDVYAAMKDWFKKRGVLAP
jgi:dienelactone hydrolase